MDDEIVKQQLENFARFSALPLEEKRRILSGVEKEISEASTYIELVQCECEKRVPLDTAVMDGNGIWTCRECYTSFIEERVKELELLINSPELEDFMKGVRLESAHQTEAQGKDNEELKYPHDYALVLDKLKGKQALAIWDKDTEKYMHHLITMASVCHNAHRQMKKEETLMYKWFNPLN